MKKIIKYKVPSYTKPADTHQFLHAMPCYEAVYKKSILYNQAVRLKRVCSNEDDLKVILIDLEYMLINRNTRKYGPEKTPYLDTFHAVSIRNIGKGTSICKQFSVTSKGYVKTTSCSFSKSQISTKFRLSLNQNKSNLRLY